jgi:WD40 repeat protein/tRNA A-37 threonylcarbamoyl transferase component Bud32
MPKVYQCARGHRWEAPHAAAEDATGTCPVCGAPSREEASRRTDTAAGQLSTVTLPPGASLPTFAGYEILGELGRGGMGVVYKARQVGTQRLIALKVIRKERLTHPEAVRRFRRESQAAARLAHPNIVLVYESDQAGDTHYLAMEFVDGVTLQRLVEDHGPLPVAQACECIRQAALGLQHAHEQSLVHRDIKPSNLMLTAPPLAAAGPRPIGSGIVKILDMGVARLYQTGESLEESLTTLTQDGAVIGTPDYIAPEQLEDAHQADIRADLYSLGCTFYFLLTSRVPFPGGTLVQKMDKQRWETAPSVDQLRREVPAGVAAVVRKLMAKRPADRYQTPADLVAALDQLTQGGQVAAPTRPAPVRELRRFLGHDDGVWSVAFTPDSRSVLSGSKDRTLRLWDVESGRPLGPPAILSHEIRSVVFTPDGRLALVGCGIGVRLWDMRAAQEVGRYTRHTNTVKAVAVSLDGRRALSAGDDRAVSLWQISDCREVRRLARHKGDVNSVAFSPDGRLGLSGSRDQTIRLWNLEDGRELSRFPPQKGMVLSVAFSPDGRYALSGNFDTTMRLWDVATGRELRRFQGHKQMVAAVAFSPDGRRVLSGSHDQTVRLWDLESGHELCCFGGHTGAVTCLAFSPDGRHAVSGGADKALCLWQLPH